MLTPEDYEAIRKYFESLGLDFESEHDKMSDEYTHTFNFFDFRIDAGLSLDMRLMCAPYSRFQLVPDGDRYIIVYAN